MSNRRDDLSLLGPVEAHGVHRLQNLQQSPGDDLVIAAGVGGNFSGGGNILVVIGGSRVFFYKEAPPSIQNFISIFGTSIQSSLSSVPSTCGSVLERDVNEWSMLFSENYILIHSI